MPWNHTLEVHNKHYTTRCCSFENSPMKEGYRYSVHKGKLIERFQTSDAVVKVYHHDALDFNCNTNPVAADMEKYHFVEEVLRKYPIQGVRLARTFQSEVDKVGKGGKMKKALEKGKHHVRPGESVVVQDFVKGDFRELFALMENQTTSRSCQTTTNSCLLELVTMSYTHSKGTRVISTIEGVRVSNPREDPGTRFLLTSFTIHSRSQEFGEKDLGPPGVEMYERWSGMTPRVPASAPPSPEFFTADRQESFTGTADNVFGWSAGSSSQPQAYRRDSTDLPSARCSSSSGQCMNWTDSRLPAQQQALMTSMDHVDGNGNSTYRRQSFADVLAVCPNMRAGFHENQLTYLLGPAPAYSLMS